MNKKDVRISLNSYHGKKVIGVSIEKHNEMVKELENKIKELETEIYYIKRNKVMEDIVEGKR